ncbi:MAG TPA: hypothetical protein PKC86_02295 [Candidatus Saccharibacteria bacterium]|nr:hypothetical protein [Candidatus Saccharibacteria bacterium]
MISLPREEGWKVWDKFWNEATEEFFKVEDVQDYSDEDNNQKGSLAAWMRGDKIESLRIISKNKSKWAEQTSTKPIRKIRIHVVDKPYTEYLKWEIEHYKLVNIPLGKEEVYLVDRNDVPGYSLGDFMMFDSKRVTQSNYSAGGRMQSMNVYNEGESITEFLNAKTHLMKYAKRL